jgi:hypothetical protein
MARAFLLLGSFTLARLVCQLFLFFSEMGSVRLLGHALRFFGLLALGCTARPLTTTPSRRMMLAELATTSAFHLGLDLPDLLNHSMFLGVAL